MIHPQEHGVRPIKEGSRPVLQGHRVALLVTVAPEVIAGVALGIGGLAVGAEAQGGTTADVGITDAEGHEVEVLIDIEVGVKVETVVEVEREVGAENANDDPEIWIPIYADVIGGPLKGHTPAGAPGGPLKGRTPVGALPEVPVVNSVVNSAGLLHTMKIQALVELTSLTLRMDRPPLTVGGDVE